jgi:hypothetical protein
MANQTKVHPKMYDYNRFVFSFLKNIQNLAQYFQLLIQLAKSSSLANNLAVELLQDEKK